jgi:hypothetical protein
MIVAVCGGGRVRAAEWAGGGWALEVSMPNEINWERSDYESRVDVRADDIDSFVAAVLDTIDVKAARLSPQRWQKVCRFFAGCRQAALAQGATPRDGGKLIAAYLETAFPYDFNPSTEGFFEFMDWLSNPEAFHPTALRSSLEQC